MTTLNKSNVVSIVFYGLLVCALGACTYSAPSASSEGSAGNGGSGGSAGSSSSGISTEQCTNDLDDNANDLIDCADPLCAKTHQCVADEALDPKWSKPFYAVVDTFGADEPACPTNSQPVVYGIGPTPNTCTECACAITGANCTGTTVECNDGNSCQLGMNAPQTFSMKGCHGLATTSISCEVTKLATYNVTNAICNVTTQAKLENPLPFTQQLLRCDVPTNAGGGCDAGTHCAMNSNVAYPLSCIAITEKIDCPVGWNDAYQAYDSTWQDTRGCAPCTCAKDKAICSPDNVATFHTTPDCMAPGKTLSVGTCTNKGNGVAVEIKPYDPIFMTEGCGTSPQGKLDLPNPTTICCRPTMP